MNWTTPDDLRAQVRKLWNRGMILAGLATGEQLFPRRLVLRGPASKELAERFGEVRDWIARLDAGAGHYRIVWRRVNHRILGGNDMPAEVWIDSMDQALALIGRQREASCFGNLLNLTGEREPDLTPWLAKRPLRALELAGDWERLLAIVAWLKDHPRPGIYLRQVDITGVHSKFIEDRRAVLAELLDLALPPETIDYAASGLSGFCRRYGFCDKPLRLRFRLLDPALALLATSTDQDLTLTHDTFARLALPVRHVFITENEINFLAFPHLSGSMVIFGAGYGFEMLAVADWLKRCTLHYWGDIDTHGFAILDQLRNHFPSAQSFLMDRDTLLAHRQQWGREPQPVTRDLHRLTAEEAALYDVLRRNILVERLRLEQERIGFKYVMRALERLQKK
ncbi:MAG: DUF3322 domain-containing protein [Desulfobulbaceae bacterium]|nr:DUF3322 domain-containing protein [Desulfobulbaceae bacterium]